MPLYQHIEMTHENTAVCIKMTVEIARKDRERSEARWKRKREAAEEKTRRDQEREAKQR